jgi:hypothetical protein
MSGVGTQGIAFQPAALIRMFQGDDGCVASRLLQAPKFPLELNQALVALGVFVGKNHGTSEVLKPCGVGRICRGSELMAGLDEAGEKSGNERSSGPEAGFGK